MQQIAIEDELLKVDSRGHVRVSRERREAILDEYERCGVSAVQFAAHIGVKYGTFAHWRQKRGKARSSSGQAALTPAGNQGGVQWVEAVVEGRSDTATSLVNPGLSVLLPGGARLEIAGTAQVALAAELLQALGTKPRVGC